MVSDTDATTEENIWRDGAVAGALAGVVNVVLWVIGKAAGLDFTVEVGGNKQDVLVFQPFVSSFLGAILATAVLWLLRKAGRGGVWRPLVLGLGVLSLISPLTAAPDLGSGIVLAVMHVAVIGLLITRVPVD
ncbi:MAG: DUF6069 family protein [Nocardioides sp.]